MRLTAQGGHVLFGDWTLDALGDAAGLPEPLGQELRAWAVSADRAGDDVSAGRAGDDVSADRAGDDVSAGVAGAGQDVSGRGAWLAALVAAARGERVQYVDPVSGAERWFGPGERADPWREPTPWAAGLAVVGFLTVVVAAMDVALTAALCEVRTWLGVPANVLIALGLAPTVWLLRDRPTWRWVAYGIAFGLVAGWSVLLVLALD